MKKDIEILETALDVIKKKKQESFDNFCSRRAIIRENELRSFLSFSPDAIFKKTDKDCIAFIDGVKFYFVEDDEFDLDCLCAEYKKLHNFLGFKFITNECTYVYSCNIEKILKKHLKSLKWEVNKIK